MKKLVIGLASMVMAVSAMAFTIDGIQSPGEWSGATFFNIGGNQGKPVHGTVGLYANSSFLYALFSFTTDIVDGRYAYDHGESLSIGIHDEKDGGSDRVSFAMVPAEVSHLGVSGNLDGFVSEWKEDGVLQKTLPSDLLAVTLPYGNSRSANACDPAPVVPLANAVNTYRITEMQIPLSTLGLLLDADVLRVTGYASTEGLGYWYPPETPPWSLANYAPVPVDGDGSKSGGVPASVPDGGMTLALLGGALAGLAALRSKWLV